jgi:hypothetical protein
VDARGSVERAGRPGHRAVGRAGHHRGDQSDPGLGVLRPRSEVEGRERVQAGYTDSKITPLP